MSILINSNRTCSVQTTTKIAFKAKWGGGGVTVMNRLQRNTAVPLILYLLRWMQHLQNDTAIIIEEWQCLLSLKNCTENNARYVALCGTQSGLYRQWFFLQKETFMKIENSRENDERMVTRKLLTWKYFSMYGSSSILDVWRYFFFSTFILAKCIDWSRKSPNTHVKKLCECV